MQVSAYSHSICPTGRWKVYWKGFSTSALHTRSWLLLITANGIATKAPARPTTHAANPRGLKNRTSAIINSPGGSWGCDFGDSAVEDRGDEGTFSCALQGGVVIEDRRSVTITKRDRICFIGHSPISCLLMLKSYMTSFSLISITLSISAFNCNGKPGISTLRKPRTMVAVASSSLNPRDIK